MATCRQAEKPGCTLNGPFGALTLVAPTGVATHYRVRQHKGCAAGSIRRTALNASGVRKRTSCAKSTVMAMPRGDRRQGDGINREVQAHYRRERSKLPVTYTAAACGFVLNDPGPPPPQPIQANMGKVRNRKSAIRRFMQTPGANSCILSAVMPCKRYDKTMV